MKYNIILIKHQYYRISKLSCFVCNSFSKTMFSFYKVPITLDNICQTYTLYNTPHATNILNHKTFFN